jgi:hypothetical protein
MDSHTEVPAIREVNHSSVAGAGRTSAHIDAVIPDTARGDVHITAAPVPGLIAVR